MRSKLDDPKTRARFLKAYAKTSNMAAAARAAGLNAALVGTYRHKHADFRAECDAAVAGVARRRVLQTNWTPASRETFLAALAEVGSVQRAAQRTGLIVDSAYHLRRRDAAFAAAWAEARDRAMDRVEDKLFEAVLDGFEQTVETGGVVTTRRTQHASAMFRLLDRRARPGRTARTLELTPALLAEARDRFEAALRRAAETGELPPPALATLPAPTVTAR
jgi:hypothetical protein